MGLTVFDAGVLIGFLDSNDTHHGAAHQALSEAVERNDRIVLPGSALAESLVGPYRRGSSAAAQVTRLIERVPIEIAACDEDVATAAAALRASHRSLRPPDALVIATASTLDADRLVTTDRDWPSARELGLRAAIMTL